MQVTEQVTYSKIIEVLSKIACDLPFKTEEAWLGSLCYMGQYLVDHADNGSGLNTENVSLLAAARMNWLLERTRPSLSGLLSESDVETMLNCYQGDIFSPRQMINIASALCDDNGIECDEYQSSHLAPLVDKLLGLNTAQHITLADALEQAWHRGLKQEKKMPKEFFASLGIELV